MIIKKLIPIFLAILACNSSCYETVNKAHWQFSADFLAQHGPKNAPYGTVYQPAHVPLHLPHTAPQESSLLSYENAQRMINIATIIFATIKIYERYQAIGVAPVHDQSWTLALTSWCPAMLHSVGMYGNFLIDSTTIVFEALIYKAIAKLLLLCAHGDISDLIGSIADGGLHAAKQLL